jgi:hypothetical protein
VIELWQKAANAPNPYGIDPGKQELKALKPVIPKNYSMA